MIISYEVAYIIVSDHPSLTYEQNSLMWLQFFTLALMNLTKILHQMSNVNKKMVETETLSLTLKKKSICVDTEQEKTPATLCSQIFSGLIT